MGIFNDVIIILSLIFIIKFGTGLINYYYNFYHIYKYLNYEQKIEYFKNINVIKLCEEIKKKSMKIRTICNYTIKTCIKMTYIWLLFLLSIYKSLNSTTRELDENLISLDIIEYIDNHIVNTTILDDNINEIINTDNNSNESEMFIPSETSNSKEDSDNISEHHETIDEYVIIPNIQETNQIKIIEEPIELDINDIEFGVILENFNKEEQKEQKEEKEKTNTTRRLIAKKKK